MYVRHLLMCVLLGLLLVEDSLTMSCVPCFMRICSEDLRCPGGKVMDVCNCCLDCARVKDEECGGLYDIVGICDQDLECVKSSPVTFNSVGVCKETFIEKLRQLAARD